MKMSEPTSSVRPTPAWSSDFAIICSINSKMCDKF